jgi:hypothetical protein
VKKKRIAALIFAAAVLCLLVCSPFVIALESHHDCRGEHCPVCALIAAQTDMWMRLSHAAAAAAVSVPFILAAISAAVEKAAGREGYDRSRNGIRLLN